MGHHRLFVAIVGAMLVACRGFSADPEALRGRIDPLVKPILDSQSAVGLVVGILDQGKTATFGYGKLSPESDRAPDERTVFEIGSVSKVFTALALAQMVQEKLVALDDPVAKWLPESVPVPKRENQSVLLKHLATHTSGLPRIPLNLMPHLGKHPDNPYAKYSVEELYDALRKEPLASTPGTKYAYSNLGMGLLGHVLARRAGTGYEELVRTRIWEPLGMKDTCIALSESQRSRLAPGFDGNGERTKAWDLPTLAGAGAIRSTAHDLLLFLAANVEPRKTPFADAIQATHVPRYEIAKETESIALGWHVRVKEAVVWHNGQTGSHHAFIAFNKERKQGVVVLCNTATSTADQLGLQLMNLLAGKTVEPLKLKTPPAVGPAVLERYVGNYELYPGVVLAVTRDADRLFAQMTGQAKLRVYPESDDEFAYRLVDAKISFVREKDGSVNKLIIHQHGLDIPAWKHGVVLHFGKQFLNALSGKADQSGKTTPPGKPAPKDTSK